MTPTPLAIIQARMGSTRLPGKVLLPFGSVPLLLYVYQAVVEAVGPNGVVVACPDTAENAPLRATCDKYGVECFAYRGDENDVLGRFWHCAHFYRWHPDTMILRVTPDDPWKDARSMSRVLAGERLPVEMGGEAFTLAMLDDAQHSTPTCEWREHIGIHCGLFPTPAPPAPPFDGVPWSIDTREDYEACLAWLRRAEWPSPKITL